MQILTEETAPDNREPAVQGGDQMEGDSYKKNNHNMNQHMSGSWQLFTLRVEDQVEGDSDCYKKQP